MENISKIESFFSSLNFNWQDIIEHLPIGILFFDENWKIKSINREFVELFGRSSSEINLDGVNLFSKNYLSDKLPLGELLSLRDNKDFEKSIEVDNENSIRLNIKGSAIIIDEVFKGGIIIAERDSDKIEVSNLSNLYKNSITKILSKISNCFLIVNSDGIIEAISSKIKNKHSEIFGKEGEKFTDIFSSESELSIKSLFHDTLHKNNTNKSIVTYFSDSQQIKFKAVLIPSEIEDSKLNKVIVLLREINSTDEDSITYLSDFLKLKEFESFTNANSDAILKINFHGNITYWSDSSTNLFGVNEKSIHSKFIGNLFPEINQEYFEQIRKNIIKNSSWEGYLLSNDYNEDNLYRVKIKSKVNNQKTDLYVFCNKIDKNQQRLISAHEEEKMFFKDAVLKSNQMILQVNPSGIVLFSNEFFCDLFEYELDELRGKYFVDLLDEDFKLKNSLNDIENLVSSNDIKIIPLNSKWGKKIEVCYSVNISTVNKELKFFTIYLRECNTQDKLFLETSHALLYKFNSPVVIVDSDKIIKVNPKFCKLFGSEFEADFFNLPVKQIIDSESEEDFDAVLHSSIEVENYAYLDFVKSNGEKFKARVEKICCTKESSFSVLVLNLEESEEKLIQKRSDRIKSNFTNEGPFYWSGIYENEELKLDYIDSDFITCIGYTYSDSISQINFLNEVIHPNDIENVNFEINNLITKNPKDEKNINYRIINKNGEIVWISNKVRLDKLDISGKNKLVGSISDITERSLEREELKSIIDELDKLNTAKEKFISIISHDLKSPFTSIVGFAELILTDATLTKDEIIEFVSHIKEASFHTVDLLNSLLDLTKLQTGRIDVEPKIINANYITNKTVEILSGLAYQKGLVVSSNVDKSFYVTADENLIFQVFNNLVANSIKFTPKGGSIEITAKELPEKQRVEFTIKDTGVGIEKEDVDKLFVLDKKFTTLGTDGERGTGLGLSLVNEIIEKHLGEIKVKSELGKGSEFIFTLPISSPSILIFDGSKTERILYSKLLESITSSIEILQAEEEEEALSIIKDKMPMLIIFEHSLPNMYGDEFIGEIKKAGLHYEPSLLVLTNNYNEALQKSYKDIGAYNVFSKPFDLKEFKKQLDKIIGKTD